MENEILLKAIEKLLDKKLEPFNQRFDIIDSRLNSLEANLNNIESRLERIEANQQTIIAFIKEIDKEFYKVEETYKFMNDLKKVLNQ